MKRTTGTVSLCLAGLALAFAAASAPGATYYVASHGDDAAGDGSQLNPWATITFGITNSAVGEFDEIRVGEGLYNESVANGGTSDGKHRITVRGGYETNTWTWDPANHPSIVDPGSTSLDCFYMRARTNTVSGFVCRGGRNGIYLLGGVGLSKVANDTWRNYVDHCVISNNAQNGLYVQGGRYGCTVQNCLIVNNGGDGIEVNQDNATTYLFYNCTVADNGGNGFYSPHTHCTRSYLWNCIIANNAGAGLLDTQRYPPITFYTCVSGNAGGNFSSHYLWIANETVTADPRFTPGTWRLSSASPCIDAGADLSALGVSDDLETTARAGAFDMGCYESSHSAVTRHAATYVDAAGGSDANAGTSWAAAKATIGEALAVTAAGGTCRVASGGYNEQVVIGRYGVTLASTNRFTTVISNNQDSIVWLSHTNATLRGFTVTGGGRAVTPLSGLYATNTLIDQCILTGNANGVAHLPSNYSPSRDVAEDGVHEIYNIRETVISNNTSYGVYLYGYGHVDIRNCLVAGNGNDGVWYSLDNRYVLPGADRYHRLLNCTIADNGRAGVNSANTYSPATLMTNCIVAGNPIGFDDNQRAFNVFAYCCFNNTVNFTNDHASYPDTFDSTITADPSFAGGGDYHLQNGSLCVDAGIDITGPALTNDLDGVDRSAYSPYDMGCFESPYHAAAKQMHTYVDAFLGSDGNAGTNWATAKQTITAALSITDTNGTCQVASGTYNEEVSLSLGQTIEGTNWTTCILNGGGGNVVSLLADNTTVRGLTLQGGSYGVRVGSGSIATNLLIEGCIIRANTFGIGEQYTDPETVEPWTVSGCIITNNTSHGIYLSAGRDIPLIRNTLIARNGGHGVRGAPRDGAVCRIYNCTIADNAGSGLVPGTRYVGPFYVKNSVISGNGGYAIFRTHDYGGRAADYLDNCNVYGNGSGGFPAWIVTGPGTFSAFPAYSNASYALGSASPCIDAGLDLSTNAELAVTHDILGNPRSVPFDIGCYETAFSAPARHPATYADDDAADDTGAGSSPAAAKKTIGSALAATAPGGTCYVAAGVYEEHIFMGPAGVTLQGAGWESTIVTSRLSRVPMGDGTRTNLRALVWMVDTNVTIAGLTLAGGEFGVEGQTAYTTGTVQECRLVAQSDAGINAENAVVSHKRLIVDRCRLEGSGSHAVRLLGTGNAATMVNVLCAGNTNSAFYFNCGNNPGPEQSYLLHCTIVSNRHGIYHDHYKDPSTFVTNCVIARNSEYGIYKTGSANSLYVSHSFVSENTGTNLFGAQVVLDGSSVLTNGAPEFAAGTYEPSAASPFFNTGTNIGIAIDLLGSKRPYFNGYDMGAYELVPPGGSLIIVR